MNYSIIISDLADEDLTQIFEYISQDSRDRAIVFLSELNEAIYQLKKFFIVE